MAKKFTEEEARERKNARQREYAKKTRFASNTKYNKENTKRYTLSVMINTEQGIIDQLESVANKNGYIKGLIRDDIAKKNRKEV